MRPTSVSDGAAAPARSDSAPLSAALSRRSLSVTGFAVATLVFLALYAWAGAGVHVHQGGDTTAFEAVARTQLAWSDIFSTQRPPLYPALLLSSGFDRTAVVWVQAAAYLAAWIALAWVFFRAARCWWGVGAAACAYYVGLFPHFAAWNHVVMSESLSLSMTVAASACLVAFAAGAGRATFAGFVALMCLKCFLRDFDAFLCIFAIPVVLALAWYRRLAWWSAAATTALFVGVFIFVSHTADTPGFERWTFAMYDNIGRRVLPDARWRAFFEAHGMPVNDTLLSMSGRYAHEENWRFFTSPDLAAFRAWVEAQGRGTYTSYLLHHPAFMLLSLWRARDEVFQANGFPLFYYFDPAWRFGVPPGNGMGLVYVVLTGAAVAVAGLWMRGRLATGDRVLAAIGLLTGATALPVALAVHHADAMETLRHALPVLAQAALGALLLVLVLLRWAGMRREPASARG